MTENELISFGSRDARIERPHFIFFLITHHGVEVGGFSSEHPNFTTSADSPAAGAVGPDARSLEPFQNGLVRRFPG